MNEAIDNDLDVLLREQFEGPVPDGGFCAAVVDRLPARRRRTIWPMAAGTFAGVAACWFSLSSAPITYAGWQDWLSGEPSASAIALFASMLSMAILAMGWTVAEAGERYDQPSGRIA